MRSFLSGFLTLPIVLGVIILADLFCGDELQSNTNFSLGLVAFVATITLTLITLHFLGRFP
jgi:hypothetical protein